MRAAYERLREGHWIDPDLRDLGGLRALVRDSWQRSLVHNPDPDRIAAARWLPADALEAYRHRHPLAAVMPVIQRLLVEPSQDTGIVVAIGDEHGRLLWVDGDRGTLRRTERMQLIAGVDWSEQSMGTSAPGTALVIGDAVQIRGAEHFSPLVQRWDCTAVPIRDPAGLIIGVVDVTGGREAAGRQTLAWVRAAVAAAEAELRLTRRTEPTSVGLRSMPTGTADAVPVLSVLGRGCGVLTRQGRALELSVRHTELLTMLALDPGGLTAAALAELVNPDLTVTTLRAEMLRLRRVLADFAPELIPSSRPYALSSRLVVDAQQVFDMVTRGDLDEALRSYPDEVLPGSDAPGLVRLRARVSRALREAVLADGSLPNVLDYLRRPEVEEDVEAWECALRLLPRRSPRRAAIVAHLEQVQAELG